MIDQGLESGRHEEFIQATRQFLSALRAKPNLADHIHVVWYVVNAASGRIEPFEVRRCPTYLPYGDTLTYVQITLLREVFAPTPVLVVLNKADVASAEQLATQRNILQSAQLTSCKGIFATVCDRRNYAQNWCTNCFSDVRAQAD